MIPKTYPVTCNTQHVGPGSTFVAIKGYKEDGNQHISKAIQQGANTIISEEAGQPLQNGIKFLQVKNVRKTLALLSSKILHNPSSNLKIIGITGTKGKTTTVHLIEHILRQAGHKTALLGTIKNKILNKQISTQNTTPQSDYLHMFFDQCVKHEVTHVVMEVSAHAISLHRTYGIKFDAIGFTNLEPDHLDFYKNMQRYFYAKYKLFGQIKTNGSIVINTNDAWGKKVYNNLKTYKKYAKAHIFAFNQNSLMKIDHKKLLGKHNQYNMTMAGLICKQLGISENIITKSINSFEGVKGRLQMHILQNGAKAFVDFAHNPSSMEAILKTLQSLTKDLIVVFGCGGDRDKTKRPVMGKIAAEIADKIIITDDNPRFENSKHIAQDILKGITKQYIKKCIVQLDRKKAIKKAAQISTSKSIIALLGKGHENYYLVEDKKFYLDDFEQISKY